MNAGADPQLGAVAKARDWMWRHPSAVLLFVQLLAIVLYPLLQDVVGRAVFGAFSMVVLALAGTGARVVAGSLRNAAAVADRSGGIDVCFDATFNDDMWAHQYDQQANQVVCKVSPERIYTNNGPDANLFGLEPAGDNGTYFQKVSLLGITTDEAAELKLAVLGPLTWVQA